MRIGGRGGGRGSRSAEGAANSAGASGPVSCRGRGRSEISMAAPPPPRHEQANASPRPDRRLFTVGHSNRTVEDLCSVLAELDLRSIVDVRRYPRSRRHPQFVREELAGSLLRHGIAYHWLGRELGGRVQGSYES